MPRSSWRLRVCGTAALTSLTVGAACALTPPAVAATAVYSEDFSDGLGTFTAAGSVSTGTYGARMSGSLFSDPALTSAPIDLTGRSEVTVSYTRAASGLDLGETFTAAYSVDGGSFTSLESARTAAGAASFRLPDSVEGHDVRLRFSLDANSIAETLTVDDVLVRAEDGGGPTDPPGSLPPVSDVTAPGPYAVTIDESAGPDGDGWLVYPADAGRDGVDHPVLVWGPGAGSDPAAYEDMLRQWASHGFVVYSEVSSSSGDYMVDALDWLEDQNAATSSPLHQDLDLAEVAFGGHSRGSIGTFDVADDPRLETTIHVAGGSFDGNGPAGLRNPALYIGGDDDFATPNVERDYTNTGVPVWFNILNGTDHVAATRNGQHIITAWLRWHLADEEFRRTQDFLSAGCTFCGLGEVRHKNW
ncbi:poly(ethylene terephthalate) hydrolase family protein [Streptomyces longisporoflavus]|uniref:PET hydrolase/cutinase-like domain-containing protein n=1 Tax=Streptomyces longisporoflavus TaxID=28044 RepID=A0ABW7QKA8_9ACTN